MSTSPTANLPAPSHDEREHSARLVADIRNEIARAGGVIDFARFMELALYAPGLGYYSAGAQKFGRDGDFVTAPEISPLFARCLARQCVPVLAQIGGDILEVGAGSGALAADLLHALELHNQLPDRYLILDVSADLRARQEQRLRERVPHLLARVKWLTALPARIRGMVIANELLDAMPVTRFHITKEAIAVQGVGWQDDRFVWRDLAADDAMRARVYALGLAPDYISEINTRAEAWVRAIGERLDAGAVLILDYGFPRAEYYHPDRHRGTVMCHYRHRTHSDPLILVGLQDITAHVDFTAIAEAAQVVGLRVAGYTSQAAFLLSLGITELAADATDSRAQLAYAQHIKTLTLPSEMGELFKVMALTRGLDTPLHGFALQDRRTRL